MEITKELKMIEDIWGFHFYKSQVAQEDVTEYDEQLSFEEDLNNYNIDEIVLDLKVIDTQWKHGTIDEEIAYLKSVEICPDVMNLAEVILSKSPKLYDLIDIIFEINDLHGE